MSHEGANCRLTNYELLTTALTTVRHQLVVGQTTIASDKYARTNNIVFSSCS